MSANGKFDTEELTCKPKTEFERIETPERSGQVYDTGSGTAYDPEKMKELIEIYNNTLDISWEKLKKYAYDKYGITEDNFIGVVAWARIENYEQNDEGDGVRTYMAYLCNSLGINNAIAYEKNNDHDGWIREMEGWGNDYVDSHYYGSSGYYKSNLRMVKVALDNLYPDIVSCSGEPVPNGKKLVFKGTNQRNQTILIW